MKISVMSQYDEKFYSSYTICPFCSEKNWIDQAGIQEPWCIHKGETEYIGKSDDINVYIVTYWDGDIPEIEEWINDVIIFFEDLKVKKDLYYTQRDWYEVYTEGCEDLIKEIKTIYNYFVSKGY